MRNILPEDAQIIITEQVTDYEIVFTIEIADEYKGLVIGKGGKNIGAVRKITSLKNSSSKRLRIDVAD